MSPAYATGPHPPPHSGESDSLLISDRVVENGEVWAWGEGEFGALGRGDRVALVRTRARARAPRSIMTRIESTTIRSRQQEYWDSRRWSYAKYHVEFVRLVVVLLHQQQQQILISADIMRALDRSRALALPIGHGRCIRVWNQYGWSAWS